MLPEAVKDYSSLTVHLWKTGGGKTAFGRNGAELVQGMANTVITKPDENWLIITHRQGGKVGNVEAQLRRLLPPGVSARVSVLTWGRHMFPGAAAKRWGPAYHRPSLIVTLTTQSCSIAYAFGRSTRSPVQEWPATVTLTE